MDLSSSYMSYRGLVTNGVMDPKRGLKGQFYATASDESVAADSGVFEAANVHKSIDRTDSGNSVGSYWYVVICSVRNLNVLKIELIMNRSVHVV